MILASFYLQGIWWTLPSDPLSEVHIMPPMFPHPKYKGGSKLCNSYSTKPTSHKKFNNNDSKNKWKLFIEVSILIVDWLSDDKTPQQHGYLKPTNPTEVKGGGGEGVRREGWRSYLSHHCKTIVAYVHVTTISKNSTFMLFSHDLWFKKIYWIQI